MKFKNLKIFISVFVLIIFSGCGVKQPVIGKKAFPKEDSYIIKALFYENNDQLKKAVKIYKLLYSKTQKPVYYEKMLGDLFYMKKYKDVLNLCNEYLKNKFDKKVFKYKILSLLELKRTDEAKKELLEKLNKKDEFFYKIMSYVYIKEGKYNEASEYLKSLYALNHDKDVLLHLVDVLIKMKKYNEALAYLRTHLDLYGCEYDICSRLAIIYKQTYDFENLAAIYKKMARYDIKYALYALNIYMNTQEYKKALKIIRKYRLGDEYILAVYESMKNYKKAAFIAKKIYEETADLRYLYKYCIFKYESSPNKKTALKLIPKLKYLLGFYKSAYLYNFIGYIMIDYDINVKEGIKYVQKALELKPDDEEYIDSLAWGYFKLGKCKDAWEIMKYVKLKDKEILKHKRSIEKCLRNRVGKEKRRKR